MWFFYSFVAFLATASVPRKMNERVAPVRRHLRSLRPNPLNTEKEQLKETRAEMFTDANQISDHSQLGDESLVPDALRPTDHGVLGDADAPIIGKHDSGVLRHNDVDLGSGMFSHADQVKDWSELGNADTVPDAFTTDDDAEDLEDHGVLTTKPDYAAANDSGSVAANLSAIVGLVMAVGLF